MDSRRVARVREDMERAEARRLQPHYVESFFLEAFRRLGGAVRQREPRRYEITHVPAPVRNRDRRAGTGEPVLKRYERIAFDKALLAPPAAPPPHPQEPSAALGARASRPQWAEGPPHGKAGGTPASVRTRRSQGSDITESIAGRRTNPRRFVEDFTDKGLWKDLADQVRKGAVAMGGRTMTMTNDHDRAVPCR